jgi:hypothetical protein
LVRQARSAATRRRIIDSAVELVNGIGYPASGLADIIERAELTKGALRGADHPTSPAMANIVNGLFSVTEVIGTDRIARATCRLLRTFGGFNPAAKNTYATLLLELRQRIAQSVTDGDDLRPCLTSTLQILLPAIVCEQSPEGATPSTVTSSGG